MHLLFIVTSDTNQSEDIANQLTFDYFVEWGGTAQGGEYINFQQPRLQVLIY
jgi:hypothetical protein